MLKIILVAVAVVVCCKGVECAGGVLKFTQVDVQQTSSVNNDFVKCMAKCLGHSVAEIEEWVAECGTDVKCWLEKVGIEAIKCVPRCLSVEIDAKRVADIATVREKGEVGNNFAICLAKCLGRSVADIERWIGECGENVKCWVKKVGFAALKCVPKCVSLEGDAVQNVVANTPENKGEVGNNFAICLAKCLGRSVADIERWIGECGENVKCWVKKVGFAALKCVPKCVSLEGDAVQNVVANTPENKEKVEVGNDFANCLAKCLGKSVADIERWLEECGTDVHCWLKKVGFAALKCVPECVSLEVYADVTTTDDKSQQKVEVGNDFANCLAKCLGKSVADIERWLEECGTDVHCWLKKVGFAALKCVPECVSLEVYAVQNVFSDSLKNKDHVDNDVVSCLARCLGKSVADIERWIEECKKNVKCWAKKVGIAALKCVPKCTLTAPTRSITLGSWRLEVLNYNTQGEGRRFVQ